MIVKQQNLGNFDAIASIIVCLTVSLMKNLLHCRKKNLHSALMYLVSHVPQHHQTMALWTKDKWKMMVCVWVNDIVLSMCQMAVANNVMLL